MKPLVALITLLLPGAVTASDPSPAAVVAPDRGSAGRLGGRLSWVSSQEVDLLGDLWTDLRIQPLRTGEVFFHLDSRLTMQKPDAHFTFRVRDLQYDMHVGWRGSRPWAGPTDLAVFLGQRGRERVDSPGQALVQYVGLGLSRPAWGLRTGAVFHEREVQGRFVVSGEGRLRLASGRRSVLGLEVEAEALLHEGSWLADLAAGPRLSFPLANGVGASLQLLYQRGRHPLGLEQDHWLLGFAYEKASSDAGDPRRPRKAPDIDGAVSAGGGPGRKMGRLFLRFRSPPVRRDTRVAFAVEGNILTAQDTGELYYRYSLGLERPVGAASAASVDFYHRSNHRLAEPGDRITSINIVEAGVETLGWQRAQQSRPRPRYGLDACAHVGYLVDGSFPSKRRWHARGGLRWFPPLRPERLYLQAMLEAGDVSNQSYSVGTAIGQDWALELEYRSDDQYFSEDRTALLLVARYGF